jgi:hypothetical protein
MIGVQENSNPTAAASFKRFRPWCVSEPLSGQLANPYTDPTGIVLDRR